MSLPLPERRDEIRFLVAKRLPYNVRLKLAFALMAAGLILETVFLNSMFWIGLPVVFAGVLLLLTKGFENKVDQKRAGREWRPARREEIQRIIELNIKQKEWDRDIVDISCGRGFLTLVGISIVTAVAGVWLLSVAAAAGVVLIANAAVMILPFWVTGTRSILKNDKLVTKAMVFLDVERAFDQVKQSGEEFQYQIQTAEAKDEAGEVPRDVKAIVAFNDAPGEFLGVQMQIAINSVQGTDYPYFYCVLVARTEFGGLRTGRFGPPPHKVLAEPKKEGDVDIVVIRQKTTKNSGYHTKVKAVVSIFMYSLTQARRILDAKK